MTVTDAQDIASGDAYHTPDGDEFRVIDQNSLEVLIRSEAGSTRWVTKTALREHIDDGRLEPADAPSALLTADPDDLIGKTVTGRHANGDRECGVIQRVIDHVGGRSLEVKTGDDWTTMVFPEHGDWEVVE